MIRRLTTAWLTLCLTSTVSAETQLRFMDQVVSDAQLRNGKATYQQHCANCHSADLHGQTDWRRRLANGRLPAPPHDATGHTWHHADRDLFQMTKLGIQAFVAEILPDYESDMPAFEPILADQEIADVLAYIKSTWPEKQKEHQERINQAALGR